MPGLGEGGEGDLLEVDEVDDGRDSAQRERGVVDEARELVGCCDPAQVEQVVEGALSPGHVHGRCSGRVHLAHDRQPSAARGRPTLDEDDPTLDVTDPPGPRWSPPAPAGVSVDR